MTGMYLSFIEAALARIISRVYRRLCLQCFCIFRKWLSSLMQPGFFAFTDVFCYPSQIPAWCQEPLLVRGIHWEYHFGPVQDKLVCSLLEALPDGVSALEEHFPRTLVPPRRETLPHAVPSLFLYHWPAKVRHNGPVRQTEAAPWRQVHHFQRATLVDPQEVWWVKKTIICCGRGLHAALVHNNESPRALKVWNVTLYSISFWQSHASGGFRKAFGDRHLKGSQPQRQACLFHEHN